MCPTFPSDSRHYGIKIKNCLPKNQHIIINIGKRGTSWFTAEQQAHLEGEKKNINKENKRRRRSAKFRSIAIALLGIMNMVIVPVWGQPSNNPLPCSDIDNSNSLCKPDIGFQNVTAPPDSPDAPDPTIDVNSAASSKSPRSQHKKIRRNRR